MLWKSKRFRGRLSRSQYVFYNYYTSFYDALLKKSGQSYLYISRLSSIASETFKCLHQLNPEFLHDCFTNFRTTYELRYSDKLVQPKVRTDPYGINSFHYQGAKVWNMLPAAFKESSSVEQFKSIISNWNGPECMCGFCILCKLRSLWCDYIWLYNGYMYTLSYFSKVLAFYQGASMFTQVKHAPW